MPFMYYPYAGNSILLLALLVVFVLGMVAQAKVNRTFNQFAGVCASASISAVDVVHRLLAQNNLSLNVTQVKGRLTDHFNPRTNTVGLSEAVYHSDSISALAVAAHEIGHVMQYEEGYVPIRIRNAILPVASFGSQAAPFIVILGLLMSNYNLAMIGVILFGAMFVFQLVTLPVEFNASNRALEMLSSGGFLTQDEVPAAKKVLNAAAMTYVVAALASLISLLRLLTIAQSSRRD